MFPNIPPAAVQFDLQKTGSVEVTCDNILQNGGTLPMVRRKKTFLQVYYSAVPIIWKSLIFFVAFCSHPQPFLSSRLLALRLRPRPRRRPPLLMQVNNHLSIDFSLKRQWPRMLLPKSHPGLGSRRLRSGQRSCEKEKKQWFWRQECTRLDCRRRSTSHVFIIL